MMDELALIVSKGTTTTTDERISRGKKDPQWGMGMDCIKDEPLRGFESDLNGRLTFKRQGKGPSQLQPSSLPLVKPGRVEILDGIKVTWVGIKDSCKKME